VLVWLPVWSEVQIVRIWSSWCHCHPKTSSSLASFKPKLVLPFWYWLPLDVLEKTPLNGCSNSSSSSYPPHNCILEGKGNTVNCCKAIKKKLVLSWSQVYKYLIPTILITPVPVGTTNHSSSHKYSSCFYFHCFASSANFHTEAVTHNATSNSWCNYTRMLNSMCNANSYKHFTVIQNRSKICTLSLLNCLQCFEAVGWVAGRASGQ